MKKLVILLLVAIMVISVTVPLSFAAVTQLLVTNGTYTETYTLTFSADSDTYHSMTHGLGAAPDEFTVTALDANCLSMENSVSSFGNVGMPFVNGVADIGASAVGIGKPSVRGSATCAVRVMVRIIHSLIK